MSNTRTCRFIQHNHDWRQIFAVVMDGNAQLAFGPLSMDQIYDEHYTAEHRLLSRPLGAATVATDLLDRLDDFHNLDDFFHFYGYPSDLIDWIEATGPNGREEPDVIHRLGLDLQTFTTAVANECVAPHRFDPAGDPVFRYSFKSNWAIGDFTFRAVNPNACRFKAWLSLETRRRAWYRPLKPQAPIATDKSGSTPGSAASNRLASLIADGESDLLLEWLQVAKANGYVVPETALPLLLDIAVRDVRLRPAVVAGLGDHGRWRAQFKPEWAVLLADDDSAAATVCDDLTAWPVGELKQRLAWFTAARRFDPSRARELLSASWNRESPHDRVDFLERMDENLSEGDAPFLESVLYRPPNDYARFHAARLLARLPGSPLCRRMAERALRYVHIRQTAEGEQLTVSALPEGPDDAMRRDNITKPPSGINVGADLLEQIVQATPLSTWTDAFAATPKQLVALPVAEGWASTIHAGWVTATRWQKNEDWARALLPHAASYMLGVFPWQSRADVLADLLIRRPGMDSRELRGLVADCPQLWPPHLAEAILSWLGTPSQGYPAANDMRDLIRLISLRMPTDYARLLTHLSQRHTDSVWREALGKIAERVSLRRQIREELP